MLDVQKKAVGALSAAVADTNLGGDIYRQAADLFPVCRSITGPGLRETLRLIGRQISLDTIEIPTGTPLFDWTAPEEWTFRDAYIADRSGRKLVDARSNPLHLMSYSIPIDCVMTRDELAPHVRTLPDQPALIPYTTAYYTRTWAFAMSHEQWQQFPDDGLHVKIDTTRAPGHLTYGEYIHQGRTDDVVLLSAHACHPGMANDNCSGLAVLTALARAIRGISTRYTYRFIFAPGTIGALAWLAKNQAVLDRVKAGLVVSCLGDSGGPTVKRSRRGNALIDRAVVKAARDRFPGASIRDFSPYGYDERQYCAPGFNLPVASLQRSSWGEFPEYHTSADNLDFIKPEHLATSARLIAATLDILEDDWRPLNTSPYGEPQLGRRGLYPGRPGSEAHMALLWVLNLADGAHTVLDMADRSGLPFLVLARAAESLRDAGLLVPASESIKP